MPDMYELLKKREIYYILDGDTEFGTINVDSKSIRKGLPYLSGPALCDISKNFGLPVTYPSSGALSRWQYVENLITHCIKQHRCSDLLAYMLSKERFSSVLSNIPVNKVDEVYNDIICEVMNHINTQLYFGGNELVNINGKFVIKKCGGAIALETPQIKVISRNYITDISNRALNDIEQGNYDSAITKSRTLLEEVFCYAVEEKNQEPSNKGDIGKLYGQVKTLYNMHADKENDRRINTLLSGLEKIVESISEMRNKESDAHGVGAKRIGISDYHARLFVNSAMTMAEFILSVSDKANKKNN